MKVVPVEDAVGKMLCHDMPGRPEDEGPLFHKGHRVTESDIPDLLRIGKEEIQVQDIPHGKLDSDTAALRVARAASGPWLYPGRPQDGYVSMTAAPGLLDINVQALYEINAIGEAVLATLHHGTAFTNPCEVAGVRVVPLLADEAKIERIEALCADAYPVIRLRPLNHLRVGIVTTGSDLFQGKVKDTYGPELKRKLGLLGSETVRQTFVGDDTVATRSAVQEFAADGVDMVLVTGGMSREPDAQTPAAIRAAGAELVADRAPTLPGALFLLAYLGKVPVLGLPDENSCGRASIFDLVVPRLLAGDRISRSDILSMGHGGFCSGCSP
ncbi:molybdopterin-binding protein [Pseudodesulfovibrio sp.]|uniref:molybdopterin-binding protein n=1 Tax=unclassified Pseudodesulfovibrio TaxID=2661612 RepID=UPI003AFF9B74